MPALDYPALVSKLIDSLRTLPGIGPRSAERIALWMLGKGREKAVELAEKLSLTIDNVKLCSVCGFYMTEDSCQACDQNLRDISQICVVEQATDILPIERSNAYKGLYHCLGGNLSPLDNVHPEDLKISELMQRVKSCPGIEVILALSANVEGEATSNYLLEFLKSMNCIVTRLAQGLPVGAGLENADSLTLLRAISGRVKL